MKNIIIFTLCIVLCGVALGGCRRNVGTDSQATTAAPTTQATTAAPTEPAPSIVPTIPAPTDILPDTTDDTADASDDMMPGARRLPEHRPIPHR